MRHSFQEFLRKGGNGNYVLAHTSGTMRGYRAAQYIKAGIPGYDEMRDSFSSQLDRATSENTRMLLNALASPDSVPSVTEADLRDVSDAKEYTLQQWDSRVRLISDEYDTHRQRIRPMQASMEEQLLRA